MEDCQGYCPSCCRGLLDSCLGLLGADLQIPHVAFQGQFKSRGICLVAIANFNFSFSVIAPFGVLLVLLSC